MSAKELKFDYASSSRAGCKGCKMKIQKNELRIGLETLFQGEHTTTSWRHLECFSLGRKYKDIDPKEIEGYYDLKKEDKARVIDYFEGGGQKKSVVDKLISTITDSEKKKKQDDDGDDNQVYDYDAEQQKKKNQQQKEKKKITKPKLKRKLSSSSEEEDDSSDSEDDFDDSETDNSGSDSDYEKEKAIQRKNQHKKLARKKKSKGKSKSSTEINIGYTPEQLLKFKENLKLYEKKTAEYLKALLGINNQPKTGTKDELVLKCADGKTLGQIPICSECGGGKLRYDIQTGIYKCPGYMDDDVFQHCGKKFTNEQIVRLPWIDDII
ncbi:poly polymerase and DNA-ligase Zn-finger region family protein (macronuclear) [Tetrahymena thermophila SB210]|uniref:Poly polymerase and DNA-ligase Zn-finger region family protein n=1 Tax=Tetrahymena thermophila (strain SB210) TaxID=312017 RepID=I7LXZ8_TETTS|nr:poly polymerase and DNA-ligase Zn-finger region family protein [Tetrahymena thermophila SB210]EAS07069.1 poly polymerase and DNA-ligase Zn-finger region family protein [Tetrahymena thermophila SB210]|eukprot:XP_001027311.1 poly polymerase and DNA-ligase Zn-finger region family protein [Tetrahymena thermophila SB210]